MEPFSLVSTPAHLAHLHLNMSLRVQKSALYVQLVRRVGGGLDSIQLNLFPVLKVTIVQWEHQPPINSLVLLELTQTLAT